MSGIEILGIAASVIQIADAGARLSSKLFIFTRKVKNADRTISEISQEIAATGAALRELGEALEQDKFAKLGSRHSIDTTSQIVADCWKVFTDINDTIGGDKIIKDGPCNDEKLSSSTTVSRFSKPSFSLKQRLKFPYIEPQIMLLKSKLEGLKSSLMLMLQVLMLAEQVRNRPQVAVSEDQKALIQTLLDERNEKEKQFRASCLAIEASNDPALVSEDEGIGLERAVTSLATDSSSSSTLLPDASTSSAAETLNTGLDTDCPNTPKATISVLAATAIPQNIPNQPISRRSLPRQDSSFTETDIASTHSFASTSRLTPTSSMNSLPETISKELPTVLRIREEEIQHHAQLVHNLLEEISDVQYRIDHGIRHRMHDGVLKIHWNEWTPYAEKHGHDHFLDTFERSNHRHVSRYWLDQHHGHKADDTAAEMISEPPLSDKTDDKKFLKFVDAIARTFNIPFEACEKWMDMKRIIDQTFGHIPEFQSQVADEHFDLMGPDGAIILPMFWEETVEPGMEVKMLLWPLPEPLPTSPIMYHQGMPSPQPWTNSKPRKEKARKVVPDDWENDGASWISIIDREVSAKASGGRSRQAPAESAREPDLFTKVLLIIAEELETDPSEFTEDYVWEDNGLEGLMALMITSRLRQDLRIDLDASIFEHIVTVGSLRRHFESGCVNFLKEDGPGKRRSRSASSGPSTPIYGFSYRDGIDNTRDSELRDGSRSRRRSRSRSRSRSRIRYRGEFWSRSRSRDRRASRGRERSLSRNRRPIPIAASSLPGSSAFDIPRRDHPKKEQPASVEVDSSQTSTSEQPVRVNAKQYARLLQRRKAREQWAEQFRSAKPTRGPALHSASGAATNDILRRPRGADGRLLTAAEVDQLEKDRKDKSGAFKAETDIRSSIADAETQPDSLNLRDHNDEPPLDSDRLKIDETERDADSIGIDLSSLVSPVSPRFPPFFPIKESIQPQQNTFNILLLEQERKLPLRQRRPYHYRACERCQRVLRNCIPATSDAQGQCQACVEVNIECEFIGWVDSDSSTARAAPIRHICSTDGKEPEVNVVQTSGSIGTNLPPVLAPEILDEVANTIKKIERCRAIIVAATHLRGATNNVAVIARADESIKEQRKHLNDLEEKLQGLQSRTMGDGEANQLSDLRSMMRSASFSSSAIPKAPSGPIEQDPHEKKLIAAVVSILLQKPDEDWCGLTLETEVKSLRLRVMRPALERLRDDHGLHIRVPDMLHKNETLRELRDDLGIENSSIVSGHSGVYVSKDLPVPSSKDVTKESFLPSQPTASTPDSGLIKQSEIVEQESKGKEAAPASAASDRSHMPIPLPPPPTRTYLRQSDPDTSNKPIGTLEDYEMQLNLLEEQTKKRLRMARQEQDNNVPMAASFQASMEERGQTMQGDQDTSNRDNHALQDYQMQLMLLEQQNKKRLMMARQEQNQLVDHEEEPATASFQARMEERKRGIYADITKLQKALDEAADGDEAYREELRENIEHLREVAATTPRQHVMQQSTGGRGGRGGHQNIGMRQSLPKKALKGPGRGGKQRDATGGLPESPTRSSTVSETTTYLEETSFGAATDNRHTTKNWTTLQQAMGRSDKEKQAAGSKTLRRHGGPPPEIPRLEPLKADSAVVTNPYLNWSHSYDYGYTSSKTDDRQSFDTDGAFSFQPSLAAREEDDDEEELTNARKQEIRYFEQQDVSSTRNALQTATQMNGISRNDTLERLGAQGEVIISNADANLDIRNTQPQQPLKLNKNMFTVHVKNPVTARDKQKIREEAMTQKHYANSKEHDQTGDRDISTADEDTHMSLDQVLGLYTSLTSDEINMVATTRSGER